VQDPTHRVPPGWFPPRVVLYDGACGLCHRTVAWLVRRDRGRQLWFAPLQGETAARLRALHSEIPRGLDTVVLVDAGGVHLRGQAVVRAARHLDPPWRWVGWLGLLPGPVVDLAYRLVAQARHRVWGRLDVCTAPAVEDRARFLP
jgi:predicted DCC family thiol-disulfide oxidoreductase YuxK